MYFLWKLTRNKIKSVRTLKKWSTFFEKWSFLLGLPLRMNPKSTFSLPWELLKKISDSEIIILVFYTSKWRSMPLFSLFENDSKINIFDSMRALNEIFRFWDYGFSILHVKMKKCANFQFIWEWLQNQHFQLRNSACWNFKVLKLWFSCCPRQNLEVYQFSAY